MIIYPQTTQLSFEVFQSITDSRGKFETWTDIINKESNTLPINDEILGSLIKSVENVTGDSIVFKNTANKDVRVFNDDLTTDNNSIVQDKWTMFLYDNYMLTLIIDEIDKMSALDWSALVADSMQSQFVAKNDIQNAICVWEPFLVSIALGQCKIIAGCTDSPTWKADGSLNWEPWKNLGILFADIFQAQRRIRSKFSKGYKKEQARFLTSEQLSTRLLAGLTAKSASNEAYKDLKTTAQPFEIVNETYGKTMYLGQEFGMSEFTDPVTKNIINAGKETGNLIRPFYLNMLHGLLYYIESIKFFGHGQLVEENGRPLTNSRSKKVWSWVWRMNAAVLPIYARFNISFVDKIPVFPAWTDPSGVAHPALDLSKAADYNSFCNDVYRSQPQLYKAFLDGKSAKTQAEVDAIWASNTISWKPTK